MAMIPCPQPDQLEGYVYGTLPSESVESIADHIEQCSQCDETVQNFETLADSLVEKLRQPPPEDEYAEEPACRSAVQLIEDLDRIPPRPSEADSVADIPEPFGHYRLRAKLGEGGMGSVYQAFHEPLGRWVAVKLLPPDRLDNSDAVARFQREMQAVGQLNHPNIVAAYDAGEIAGQPYLVMEWVRGVNLSELVSQHGPLDVADACELIRQAATGLSHAHARGMIHRDLKPSNLMLAESEAGEPLVKILDLGLMLLSDRPIPEKELTTPGQTMGTVEYMAPEQGLDSHDVDRRADIYSLGATLYKLLCGKTPHSGGEYKSPLQLMMARARKPAPSIAEKRELPPVLARLIDRMLAIDPADRPSTAAEVADALAPFANPHHLEARLDKHSENRRMPPSPLVEASASTKSRRSAPLNLPRKWNRWLTLAGILAVLLALSAVIWLKTDGGYLRIEADPEVEVSIAVLKEGKPVDSIQVGRQKDRIWYRAGSYEIRLPADAKDKLILTGEKFTLKSRRKHTVTISKVTEAEQAKSAAVPPPAKASAPIRLPRNTLSPESTQADRAFADWPAGPGRILTLQIGPEQRKFTPRDPLPQEPFQVVEVVFHPHQGRAATEADVERLLNSNLKHLVTIGFYYQTLKTSWLEAVHQKFPDIKRLEFGASPQHIPIIRRFEQLQHLQISYRADDWIPFLAKMPTLTSLYVQPELSAEGYATLAALPRLTHLQVMAISDDRLANLAKSQSLKHFVMDTPAHAWKATNQGLAQLARIPTLESISFQRPVVDGIDLSALKAKLPHCTITYRENNKFKTLPAEVPR